MSIGGLGRSSALVITSTMRRVFAMNCRSTLKDSRGRARMESMTRPMTMRAYLDPTQEQGRAFFGRSITGSVVMLNLLKFRPIADYSASPALMPGVPISGEEAYRRYMEHTLPF